ncbi:TPA: hypothetical protein DEG75_04460 [Candidatus Dependentiae bacterium]|nr:hypothetical protein [Candidatus Dependentiae bacterium]
MFEQSYNARNKKTVCIVNIGSGFLLTDFLIIDQFLTNHTIAQVNLQRRGVGRKRFSESTGGD